MDLANPAIFPELGKETGLRSPLQADPSSLTEAELVSACRKGYVYAYEYLYRVHANRMKSIAFNIVGNISDAEDAVQDAFLKIFRNASRFKGKSAFSTWIYRVLVNACYDLLRRRTRRGTELSDEDLDWQYSPPFTASVDHPLRLTLEQSLGKLSERSRLIFLLFEVEGFKHREIAEILDIPEGTSKNIVFEAKRELQRILLESGSGR